MSEVSDTNSAGKVDATVERVGDVLRKERITKRIALETVARDLKLNVKYIKALESNDYENLPADPYIRVYLRSLARYLSLDAEDVLKRFYLEKGIPPEKYGKDLSTKLDIGVIERDRSLVPWVTIGVLVVILAAVTFYAGKKGWISIPSSELQDEVAATSVIPVADSLSRLHEPEGDTTVAVSDSATVGISSSDAATAVGIKLIVRTETDSAWIQAFTDGKPWKNTLPPNSTKLFFARDSLNLHVGNTRSVKYTLNGKSWRRSSAAGVAYFKINAAGQAEDWTASKWQTVFEGRL